MSHRCSQQAWALGKSSSPCHGGRLATSQTRQAVAQVYPRTLRPWTPWFGQQRRWWPRQKRRASRGSAQPQGCHPPARDQRSQERASSRTRSPRRTRSSTRRPSSPPRTPSRPCASLALACDLAWLQLQHLHPRSLPQPRLDLRPQLRMTSRPRTLQYALCPRRPPFPPNSSPLSSLRRPTHDRLAPSAQLRCVCGRWRRRYDRAPFGAGDVGSRRLLFRP